MPDGVPFEIMNLSVSQLRRLAASAGLTPAAQATKQELVRQLLTVDPSRLTALAADYLYAGRTSVSWFRFGADALTDENVKAALTTVAGRDVFTTSVVPTVVTSEPHLIEGLAWRPEKIVLRYVARKREQIVIQNMQLVPQVEDELFVVLVRPGRAVVEARCSSTRARTLAPYLVQVANALGRTVTKIGFDSAAADALRTQLSAKLALYTGKDTSGSIYDTLSMSKSDACDDLATEQQFLDDSANLDPVNEEIIYMSPSEQERVRILVGLRSHSLYFRTVASESIIDEVFEAVRQVNGF
jgi:hypothetical protein